MGVDKHTANIVVRVTAEERKAFIQEAEKCGLALSSWIRMVLRDKLWNETGRVPTPIQE